MQHIKILHIIPGLPTGGAERALVRLVETSDRNAFEHHVVSLKDKGTQGERLLELGADVYELKMNYRWNFIPGIFRLRTIIQSIQPDVIHCWMYHAGLVALLTSSSVPRLLGIRHSLHDKNKLKWVTRSIVRVLALASSKFDQIVYNSAESKRQHELFGFSRKKARIVYNGFDTDLFVATYVAQDINAPGHKVPSPLVFGHIARFHPYKNHRGMLLAFNDLVKVVLNVKLLLAGDGCGEDNEILVDMIKQLEMGNAVILLGPQQNMELIYAGIDVVVSPSISESFPNVIGEAMACEVPCIATDVGDSAFIIGDTGIVVPPNDTEALTNAMMKMAALAADERKDLGRRARQRILDLFPIEKSTRAYEMLFQQLQTAETGKRVE